MDRRICNKNSKKAGIKNIFKMVGIDLCDTSKNRPWTPDGKDYLIELYKLGWTADEMAEEMNRTPGSIIGEIYDLGESGKIIPEMWGSKNMDKHFPKGPLGDITIIIPLIEREGQNVQGFNQACVADGA